MTAVLSDAPSDDDLKEAEALADELAEVLGNSETDLATCVLAAVGLLSTVMVQGHDTPEEADEVIDRLIAPLLKANVRANWPEDKPGLIAGHA